MDFNFAIVLLSTFTISLAQYNQNPHQEYRQISNNGPQINYAPKQIAYPKFQASFTNDYKKPVTPSPIILSHRQSLTHDGGFKYAFAADNGLQQGETISPDGTRQGQYSYVDPLGEKITVRYSAGKEGFRILEGAHVPQPAEKQQIKNQQYEPVSTPLRYNSGPQIFAESNEKYTQVYQHQQPFRYQSPNPIHTPIHAPIQAPIQAPIPRYIQYKNVGHNEERRVHDNTIQQEPEYNDEPGKPHSFGTGYSFEFSG